MSDTTGFNELMQKYVNTDYEVLVDLAKEAVKRLTPPCQKVDPEHNGYYMLASIILSAVGADGVLSALEKKMLKEVMNINDEEVSKLIKMYDSKMPDLVDHFADNMGEDIKADTIMLVTTLAAVDEKIAKEETAFIRKLFE
ncbi:MAG: TerB family tellurite resistance protein [Oscillospiraceae bacterium]|nr:TerB family tellurite resistance protein [Oscillospiraceae bacterium]